MQHLEKQFNTYHVTMKVPKDLVPVFGKTRWCVSLKTDSLSEANLLKLPYLHRWKSLIKAARQDGASLEAVIDRAKAEFDGVWKGSGDEWYALDNLREGMSDRGFTAREVKTAHSVVSGEWCPTKEYVAEWLSETDYTDKTTDERRAALSKFTIRFKYFEQIKAEDLRAWVAEQLETSAIPTVKKRLSAVRVYWRWCEEHKKTQTSASILDNLAPARSAKKITKAMTQQRKAGERKAFTVEDYHRLVNAALEIDDQTLADTIRLAAHTGARVEELFSLTVQKTTDRFIIEHSKTSAGWREVPIHRDITQLVSRLKDDSTDGYLLPSTARNKYGIRSDAVSKRFGRLKTSLGYGKQFVLHSFRKTLLTLLHEANVPESHAAAIVGHELSTMSYGVYAAPLSYSKKCEVLQRISYGHI